MLKQSFSKSKAKKVLTILLAVLFVASLTVGAASACHSHGHHHSCDSCNSCGSSHCNTCGSANSHACGSSHGHCCNEKIPCHHGSCNDDTTYENDD
jgi:hypothetical protein